MIETKLLRLNVENLNIKKWEKKEDVLLLFKLPQRNYFE